MFGMGFSEIVVILVIALIFLGPEKLPGAAKSISKGIRDLRKQTRELQTTIESDEHIGGAIRDLRSAMRGEEPPRPPKPPPGVPIPGDKPKAELPKPAEPVVAAPVPVVEAALAPAAPAPIPEPGTGTGTGTGDAVAKVTLPEVVGEREAANDDSGLETLIRPADGTVAKGS